MIATKDYTGDATVILVLSAQERDDLTKLFYNLRDGVPAETNVPAEQLARIRNFFSPLYTVFDDAT